MTAQQITHLLVIILSGLFLAALILLVLALYELRRSRRGPYWRLRRQAGQRGGKLLLTSVMLFILAAALAFYSGLAFVAFRGIDSLLGRSTPGLRGVVVPTATLPSSQTPVPSATRTAQPVATITPSPTPTDLPTFTPTPTASPSASATPSITPTATPTSTSTITWTPSPTYESVLNLTLPASARMPRAGALIEIVALDDRVSADRSAPSPSMEFPAGLQRIYVFFHYQQMDNGVAWSRVLFRDDVPVQGQAYVWGLGGEGQSFFFFGNDTGYPPGNYEVRLYLNNAEISRAPFRVF